MSKKKNILPFGLMPSHWGVRGQTRERMKIEYEYTGETLERKLADFDYSHDNHERKKKHLFIDKKYNYINDYQYQKNLIEIDYEGIDDDTEQGRAKNLKLLKLDYEHGFIGEFDYQDKKVDIEHHDDHMEKELRKLDIKYEKGDLDKKEYDKQRATIKGEPWIHSESIYDPEKGLSGYAVEYDYNQKFIDMLREHGYEGDESQVLEQYINDICLSVAKEEGILDELFEGGQDVNSNLNDSRSPQDILRTEKLDSNRTSYS